MTKLQNFLHKKPLHKAIMAQILIWTSGKLFKYAWKLDWDTTWDHHFMSDDFRS